jgi:hypothetical protein
MNAPLLVVRREASLTTKGTPWVGGYLELHKPSDSAPEWLAYTMERKVPDNSNWSLVQPAHWATKAGSYIAAVYPDEEPQRAADHKKRVWILMPGLWHGHGPAKPSGYASRQVVINEDNKTARYLTYGVQIHQGVEPTHSEGCILVGDYQISTPMGTLIADEGARTADKVWDIVKQLGSPISGQPSSRYLPILILPFKDEGAKAGSINWMFDEPKDRFKFDDPKRLTYSEKKIPAPQLVSS